MKEPSFTPQAVAELFLSMGVGAHAKRLGDAAPDVAVTDPNGRSVHLREHWSVAPLIVVFFRGGWCHYCDLQLHEWQRHHASLRRLGATLLAISPQVQVANTPTFPSGELGFPVLSDPTLVAAEAFGIAFTLPPELIEYFAEIGTDIPVLNGNGLWALPIPATYVIDTHGAIRYADVQPDFRKRPDPLDALRALSDCKNPSATTR